MFVGFGDNVVGGEFLYFEEVGFIFLVLLVGDDDDDDDDWDVVKYLKLIFGLVVFICIFIFVFWFLCKLECR